MTLFPAIVEPTLEEQITALKATVNRLLDERATAMKERDDACALADIHTARANNLIVELRRAKDQCRELAEDNEALTQQLERAQQPRPDDPTTRWPFRRIGNAL